MKIFVMIICVMIVFAFLDISIQTLRVRFYTKQFNYDLLQPWQRIKPDADFKVLFAGDSTAVGTGLDDNAQSTSGLFSRDFPEADVENYSRNGLRLKGLIDVLNTLQNKKFDLAVLQIGANDIINFTPLGVIKDEQLQVLDLTKRIARRVIILHSGDVGESPLFIWPINLIFTWRSLRVRAIYRQSQDDRVSYIDIYSRNKGVDYRDCYARDNLHLNKKGYAIWYGYIKDQLQQLHWL
jgi:lysophospholipase L1-like esterase